MASVEGLLSEVSPSVKLTHVINAGDQLFYGDKQLYTHVEPKSSGKSQGGKGDKKDKKPQHEAHHDEEGGLVYEAIQTAKHAVQNVLGGIAHAVVPSSGEVDSLRKELADLKLSHGALKDEVAELRHLVQKLSCGQATTSNKPAASQPVTKAKEEPKEEADEEEDFDLFGSEDEEDEEQKKIRDQRLADYAAKKSKKPGPIAKSNIIYDVKPWDDTIDIKEIENHVRSIETEGLVWGTSKILPIAYGVNKLQICCVIEDEKVSTDWLEEQITSNEDLIQSVDVVAFNKV